MYGLTCENDHMPPPYCSPSAAAPSAALPSAAASIFCFRCPPRLLQGVDRLLARTMGLSLRPSPAPAGSTTGSATDPPPPLLDALWGIGGEVRRLQVLDLDSGCPLGTLLLHLHNEGSEYPFTTLIRHGSLWRPAGPAGRGGAGHDGASSSHALEEANDHDGASDSSLPVVLIRLQDPEENAAEGQLRGGAEGGAGRLSSPYSLRVLLHELGHALHYLCSGAASASDAGMIGDDDGDQLAGGSWRTSPLPPAPCLNAAQCPMDVKELPSHLLEHWASDPECLQVGPLTRLLPIRRRKPNTHCKLRVIHFLCLLRPCATPLPRFEVIYSFPISLPPPRS